MPEFEDGGGVCPSCYSNHATNPNVLCSRARDEFVLVHGPAYFDECAERIFQEFTRSRAVEGVARRVAWGEKPGGQEPGGQVAVLGGGGCQGEVVDGVELSQYQEQCTLLFAGSGKILPEDVPFQGVEGAAIVACLLEAVRGEAAEVVRGRIREEVRRWHPDKFLQKHGERVEAGRREEVMERVKRVSQALNGYGRRGAG